jgi:two-component system sensor histidine kinase KdpD
MQYAGQMAPTIDFSWLSPPRSIRLLGQGAASCAALAILTYAGLAIGVNLATIGFLYLLEVVAVALLCGFWQATLTSIVAVACLDYFFTQPVFHFVITDPHEVVALAAFEITTIVISRLSGKELRSSREAAIHRAGMEQLYELSRKSLLMDMRQEPGPQIVVLIYQIFSVQAVALFDLSLGRQDRAGEWGEGEENVAKECYLGEDAGDDPYTQTWRRSLLSGSGTVGALVIRGKLSPLVVDALASLAAIAIDWHQSFEKEQRAESASRGEQLRAAVMDALAHELKTPLTAVQTASSGLLELGRLDDQQRDLVTLIDEEAHRLNQLCTRLLLTAKLEAGQVGLQTDEVNVRELIAEVLACRPIQQDRERIQLEPGDPALAVQVDRGLLAMIVTQYVDNALKYSAPGTPIEIDARRSHTEVLISVHNIGSTIRIEDRERVFDRFYRSADRKDAVLGTGIGLSVVRKAAEAHHGHVWVISDEREGTTFFLSLPTASRRKK